MDNYFGNFMTEKLNYRQNLSKIKMSLCGDHIRRSIEENIASTARGKSVQ